MAQSSVPESWAFLASQAISSEALQRVMDDWCETLRDAAPMQASIGFESYMQNRDWESARRSLERTYGRSSAAHQPMRDTLDAAIQNKRMLGNLVNK